MSKIKKIKHKSKIILVNTNLKNKFLNEFKNENFLSGSNRKFIICT